MGVEWFVPHFDRLVGSTPEHLFVTKGDSTVIHALHRATGKVMSSWDTNELHQAYVDERGRSDPRQAVFVAQYQDSRDQNRSLYTADATGHVIAYRVFGDKPLVMIGATPGPGGTRLAQTAWLPVLRTLGTRPWFGKSLYVANAGQVFDAEGKLIDDKIRKLLSDLLAGFVGFAALK